MGAQAPGFLRTLTFSTTPPLTLGCSCCYNMIYGMTYRFTLHRLCCSGPCTQHVGRVVEGVPDRVGHLHARRHPFHGHDLPGEALSHGTH